MFFVSAKPRPLAAPECFRFAFVRILRKKKKKERGTASTRCRLEEGIEIGNVGHTGDEPDFAGFWRCVDHWVVDAVLLRAGKALRKSCFAYF